MLSNLLKINFFVDHINRSLLIFSGEYSFLINIQKTMNFTPYMARSIIKLITITVFSLLFTATQCSPYNDGMTANTKFTYTGKHAIDLSQLSYSNPSLYTNPYPSGSYHYCLVSFGGLIMQIDDYLMEVFVEASCIFYKITFGVSIGSLTSISKLTVSYLAYSDVRLYGNPFRYFRSSISKNISKDPSNQSFVYVNYDILQYYSCTDGEDCFQSNLNLTAIILLNGFKVTSVSSSLIYSISLRAQLFLSINSSKTVKVYIGSRSQVPTYVQAIAFTVFLHYPTENDQYDRIMRVYSQCIDGSNSFRYSNDKHIMESFNTFVGLTSFFISNQNLLSFQSSTIDKSIIQVVSANQLSATYIIVYSKWCSQNQPYYLNNYYIDGYFYGKCFDSCPNNTKYLGNYFCHMIGSEKYSQCISKINMEYQKIMQKIVQDLSNVIYIMIAACLLVISFCLFAKLSRKFQPSMRIYQRKIASNLVQNKSVLGLNNTSNQFDKANN